VILGKDYHHAVRQIADEYRLLFHLDGARIFNAAVGLGIDVKELTKQADSMMFCLSKGLCAPMGSMLCGTKKFIFQANRIRKQLGGGTRQAGIIAAAGIFALENLVDRLGEDHTRAKRLGQGIAEINGLSLTYGIPETNMVFFTIDEAVRLQADGLAEAAAKEGLKIDTPGPRLVRLVTHYWINDQMVDQAVQVLDQVVSQG
jgi:threonine aldolase